MGQDNSLSAVFARLREWSQFPKYSLERRIDIFLTPFLASYLSDRMEAPVTLVAPEFPIKLETSNQSVNVDYLLRRDERDPAWIFLELKTDRRSLKDSQLEHYRRARAKKMPRLLVELDAIRDASEHRAKYGRLRDVVVGSGPVLGGIEVAYLSPCSPKAEDVRWFGLQDFASWQPRLHLDLWSEVAGLLRTLNCDPT